MKKQFYLAAVIIAVFAAVVWFMDPLFLFILGVAPLLWIGLPATLLGVILLLVAVRTGRSRRPSLIILSIVCGFACFVGLAIPTNHYIQTQAVAAAKAYPERIAPLLEQYRRVHGAYPASLDQLPPRPRVPRLLRSNYGYHSDGQHYTFSFPQPGGMIDVWDYSSETHTWHLSS